MKHFAISYLSILLIHFVVSCDSEPPITKDTKNNILVIGNSEEPKGLDPQNVSGVLESNILRSIFEGLCLEDPKKEGVHLPGAAESWSANDDFTEWTFKLQPEGKWSDGKPVTSEDFEFAYHRILHPKFAAAYASLLYSIKGSEDYNKNKRSKILSKHYSELDWDIIRNFNLRGQPTDDFKDILSKKIYANLNNKEKERFLISIGLDQMTEAQLKDVKEKSVSFTFPEKASIEQKKILLDKLAEYSEKDLWQIAQVGVRIPDSHTLILNLRSPTPFLPDLTKHMTWYPVPKHLITKKGSLTDSDINEWTDVGVMVGNGPFKLHQWKFNDHIEVTGNPHYWDKSTVQLDGIRFLPISNQFTEARMFFAGQLHKTYGLASEMIELSKRKAPENLKQETYLGCNFLRCNVSASPLDHIELRKAISYAVDSQAIIDNILKGGQKRATGIVPSMGEYQPSTHTRYDPEQAKKHIQIYEKETGKSAADTKVILLTVARDSSKIIAEAFQDMLKKNIGIEIVIEQAEWGTYLDRMKKLDYGLATGGWIGDYPDPTTFLDMWKTGDGNNRTGWGNEEYEAILKQAEKEKNPSKRIRLLQQAEAIFLREYAIVPIYWYTSNYLLHEDVKNWNPLLMNNNPYKFISLKDN